MPTNATIFFENKSSVPFWDAMPKKNVTPTNVTNMELEKPFAISFADIPPKEPSMNAAPMAKKPILIFLINAIATAIASTTIEIIAILFSICIISLL